MESGIGSFIEIPEYLKYREPVARVDYSGVAPRYNSPSYTKRPVNIIAVEKEKLDALRRSSPLPVKNPAYAGVSSRFQAELRPKNIVTSTPPPLARHESVRYSREVSQNKQQSKLQHVSSKFFEVHTVTHANKVPTPRVLLEKKKKELSKELTKEGQAFKVSFAQHDNFDVMRKENAKFNRQSPTRAKDANRTSVVMEWVRHGTAIPTDRPPSPPRRPHSASSGKPFYLPGGAGGGNFERLSTSPVRPNAVVIEKKVMTLQDRLRSATTTSPPRVANEPHPRLTRAKGKLEIEADTLQRMPRMLRDNLHPHPGPSSSRTTSPNRAGPASSVGRTSPKGFSRATTAVSALGDSPPPRIVPLGERNDRDDNLSGVSDTTDEASNRKSPNMPLIFSRSGPGLSPRRRQGAT